MWRLTAEQRELRDRIREFALSEVRAPMLEVDETGDYPYEVHEALASQGFLGLAIPEEYGGGGATSVAFCAYIEELAKVSATASLMAAYVKLTALPIILAGSDEQKERFLPQLASGEKLGSYALTEPGVGSDPAALEMKAERSDGGWLLNGEKRFIGNAGISDIYVVFARSGDPGPKGISAFVVPGDADGLSAERLRTMGMPGWRLGAPRFENVEVPEENLLGQDGAGFAIAMQTFDHSRPTVASQAVGVGQGAIDLALDYAVRRHTFGQPCPATRGFSSSSRGWRRRSRRPARSPTRRPRSWTRTSRASRRSRRRRSCSPPTWQCARRSRRSRCSAATAISRSSPPSG
jgi:alkylation response protein AidB-like acyl-CoA dehydrogenase